MVKNFALFNILFMDIYIFYLKKIKYQCWYLTPCCGLEVQKPTQALQSVKGPGNIFD
jgi:hypothetical protein